MNEHEFFRKELKSPIFRTQTKQNHAKAKLWLNEYIKEFSQLNLELEKLVMENLKSLADDFYIEMTVEDNMMSYYIVDREFKSICNFFIVSEGSNNITKSLIKKYNIILDIKSLQSYAKDKGKDIINRLKKLADNINLPICLFDTNNKDENYYINLGFVNKGNIGINGERLVVYEPYNN